MATFKAIRIDKAEKGTTAVLTQFDDFRDPHLAYIPVHPALSFRAN